MRLVVVAPKPLSDIYADVLKSFGDWNSGATANGDGIGAVDLPPAPPAPEVSLTKKQKKNQSKLKVPVLRSLDESLDPLRGKLPFSPATLGTLTRSVPIKNMHKLSMMWQLPSKLKQYKTKPCDYIGHLIGHEGPGSLLAFLKKKNLGNSVCAGEMSILLLLLNFYPLR
jgi:secreted Zn-dependent insulinase-like peptidase